MFLTATAMQELNHFDLLCFIGPRMREMASAYPSLPHTTIVETGFLPFDEFPERTQAHKASLLASMHLSPALKTILYTPSSRGVGSWNRAVESLIRTLPADYNLVLRPHPRQSVNSHSEDKAQFKNVLMLAARRPHTFVDMANHTLSDQLAICDLLVSDANSPAEESLFYDIPQLILETPEFSRRTISEWCRRDHVHPEAEEKLLGLYGCGEVMQIADSPDFSQAIDKALANGDSYQGQREAYFNWVFGKRDRNAASRVADAIRTHLLAG
jgi:CDP-glycerol glycerophosphotransferase (TagB/SpsB family)